MNAAKQLGRAAKQLVAPEKGSAASEDAPTPGAASDQRTQSDASGAGGGDAGAAAAGALPTEGPVADILESIASLEEVLREETELLAGGDPKALYEVQKRKMQLAAAYETRVRNLSEDPTPLEELDRDARQALRERMTSFDRTMRKNARSVNAARAVTEDLLRSTVEIVKQQRRESGGYAASGTRMDEDERLSAPLSVDKSL